MTALYLALCGLLAAIAGCLALFALALYWLGTRDRREAIDPDTPRVRSMITDGMAEPHGDVPSLPARWPGRKGYFPEGLS